MTTYVIRNGKLVDKSRAQPLHASADAGVHIIGDEMSATRHMGDGKYYTSKRKFRDATRAAGCVEVGNETSTLLKPRVGTFPSRDQRRQEIRNEIRRRLHNG